MRLLLSEGQRSDHRGAAALLPDLPPARETLGDKSQGNNPATYCKTLYKQRHKIENMFAKLKDWRRIAMRFDRCAHAFLSAIQIAAIVIFWINQ